MLLQEPWCLPIEYVASLTWRQVREGYLMPAIERNKERDRSTMPEVDDEIPTFEEYRKNMSVLFVGQPEHKIRDAYDSMVIEMIRNQ